MQPLLVASAATIFLIALVFPQFVAGQNGVFRLKNNFNGEYLFAAGDEFAHDPQRRNVFTWKKTKDSVGNWTHWNIKPVIYSDDFTIQSVDKNNEYLYSASDDLAYDSQRRRVFTWSDLADDTEDWIRWKLIKSDACFSCYQIRSLNHNGEYLYAAVTAFDYDNDHTRVFTWRPNDDDDTGQSIWQLVPVFHNSEGTDCFGYYSPYCLNSKPCQNAMERELTCSVPTSQDFEHIRDKLRADLGESYQSVNFVMPETMDIPEDVLGGKKALRLTMSCSDLSTPLGRIHADAFKSTLDFTERLGVQNCDLTETSFAFLSGFTAMTHLKIVSSSLKELIEFPYLPQLTAIWIDKSVNFQSWYPPSQTPNLESIFINDMIDLDDQKMDSIMASMSKNFIYLKLEQMEITSNSLTRVPLIDFSVFPALTRLVLSDNPIKTLTAGSFQRPKGSTEMILYLSLKELTTIEPGAFEGDFSSTKIFLSFTKLTKLPSSVFKDLLKSMVNNYGYVSISSVPIAFDCDLAWLVVDNRELLEVVRGGEANGIFFKYLDPKELAHC